MIFHKEKLREEAHKAALSHDPFMSKNPSARFLKNNETDFEKLREFVRDLREHSPFCKQPAEEVLLDHAEFLEEQVLVIKEELTKRLVHSLPRLKKTGETRVFAICKAYLEMNDGHLDKESFLYYLRSYQEVSVLSMAEVWAIPPVVRTAVIRRLSEIMDSVKERREICMLVEDLLSGVKDSEITPGRLKEILDKAGIAMPLSGPMIAHLVNHLRERAEYTATVGEWLICKLENGPESLDQILSYEFQLQASLQVSANNLIDSMRKISRWNWKDIFEQISIVEQTLRKEKTGLYARLDFASRDVLRKRVEKLSRRLNVPENLVAANAVALADAQFTILRAGTPGEGAEKADGYVPEGSEGTKNGDGYVPVGSEGPKNGGRDVSKGRGNGKAAESGEALPGETVRGLDRRAFVAYYLLDPRGISRLRQALKSCGNPRPLPETGLMRRAKGVYFHLLAGCFFSFLFVFSLWIGWREPFLPRQWFAVLGFLLFPALEWGVAFTHWIIERTIKPVPLLRLDFSKGIPADAKTAVVIPIIWSTAEEVKDYAERLELHYLANRDANLHFALLGDFKDAESESLEQDEKIFAAAREEIDRLRKTYGSKNFHLFQRKRKWNPAERTWMGWERKRGKLVEFVELLKGKRDTSFAFVYAEMDELKDVRYIITLDSDTRLPLETARRMIGTLHLPYNRPVLNRTGTRVIEGYGMLQPRLSMSHEAAMRTRFSGLWSADSGIDPYSFAVSDPYQDMFGQGIFTGKGIFDVDVFYRVLCDRIPENRVLSHDLLEGGFLRAGLLADIELIDKYPSTFFAYQKRMHRWVRGDWQLLLWLLPKLRNRRGELWPVDLSVLTRWQIIDNVRRSLLPPVLFFTLLLGMTVLPGTPLRWMVLLLAAWFLPVLRQLITVQKGFRYARNIGSSAGQVLFGLATWPFQAVLLLDAIGRTLYRLFISKKRLLEWALSEEVDRTSERDGAPLIEGMAGGYVLCLLFLASALFSGNGAVQAIGVLLSAVWAAAPLVIRWMNQPPAHKRIAFTEPERKELVNLARQIWAFYEDYVTEEENWLPPDNVQMDPPNGTASRTSPTNIGLYLACALAARDFGFIDTPGLIRRLERTLDTLERMEKWEGHLYNWYDTRTLRPLPPKYVSTVDSGNYVGCLIAVKEGLAERLEAFGRTEEPAGPAPREGALKTAFSEEIAPVPRQIKAAKDGGDWYRRGQKLLERLEKLVQDTDFRPLFDYETNLFSIGYNALRKERDRALYDLLASEARIASFVAIALGQISVSHWNALGRTMTRVGRHPVLLSWSGTMFEYLMPSLFTKTYRKTMWEKTYAAVVGRQIRYARERDIPFGISESGYYAFDFQMNYQYRAFGVPGLGFQRGLERDLVVAPYATILAMPFAKDDSLRALKKIEKLGGRGKYGFYEAVDFTRERLPRGKKYEVVQSFMAHHQGMSLLTLANLLLPTTMADRFHRDKSVRSAELLLQEKIPARPKTIKHPELRREYGPYPKTEKAFVSAREFASPDAGVPEVNVLSNGSFTAVVANSGSGFCQYKGFLVSRWREDPVAEPWGNYVYIRDAAGDRLWSPSHLPCKAKAEEQKVKFELGRAVFYRKDGEISTKMEICVSPECNAELRRITLTNDGAEEKILEVTTYVELALSRPEADAAHPAFSKLLIRTDYDADSECLVAVRRSLEAEGEELWAAHSLFADGGPIGSVEFDTDRASFIGRGHRLADPAGIRAPLRGRTGSVADPVFAMRRRIRLEPGKNVRLFAVTSVAGSREEAIGIVGGFAAAQAVKRAFQLAWNRGRIEADNLRLAGREAHDFQRLAGRILFTPPLKKGRKESILRNEIGQSGLWRFGISGDRPIVLLRIDDRSQFPFVVKMLKGHEYLRRLGLLFDLILMNESEEEGYYRHLQDALLQAARHGVDRFGAGVSGIHVIAAGQLAEEEITLLRAAARLELYAGGASLAAQMRPPRQREDGLPGRLTPSAKERKEDPGSDFGRTLLEEAKGWLFFNGWGGFSPDGKEYRIILKNGNDLPAPWINVLANPRFGCTVSEMGTGYTWWRNSREFKLTPWANDPVLDPPGEAAYLRDEESGEVWTAAPSAGRSGGPYKITHGFGFSKFEHERKGIRHEMLQFVPKDDPVKIIRLTLKNGTAETRHLSVTYYAEWVLGVNRQAAAPFIVTEWVPEEKILIAQNRFQEVFRDAAAFLRVFPRERDYRDSPASSGHPPEQEESRGIPGFHGGFLPAGRERGAADQFRDASSFSGVPGEISWTGDRYEFLGRLGSMDRPAALERAGLSCRTGAFSEPCGAVQAKIRLDPGEEREVYILLGCEDSKEKALRLAKQYGSASVCSRAFAEAVSFWAHHLGQLQVSTPSPETDVLLNGWLLYQTLSCRMWARTAFYQAGGAFGFRDQLQDSLALLHAMPEKTREQILRHAAHQYLEGDVQHWWHEETKRGIRTRFSDDLLWLPYAVSRYIEHTGETSVLDEIVPFLKSEPLSAEEQERYEETVPSGEAGSIYEHCLRAIDLALSRVGEHGLPLIGGGDWNDGLNLVGIKGRGESVWLGWFLCEILNRFSVLCEMRKDMKKAEEYREIRRRMAESLNGHGWDGQWYRRAFTDSGKWLGSVQSEECRIDAIAQAWSVISEAAPKERALQAMDSFARELVDKEAGIVKLLTPAFERTEPRPGYIQSYPPGIRENGSQYTHGVIWGIIAWCKLGNGEKAVEIFEMLNPINHTRTEKEVRIYAGEPYAIAADVYSAEPNRGRAGWTWYTGSAGWYYQAGVEWILGIRRRANRLYIDPRIPADWPGFSVTYRFGGTRYLITVINRSGKEKELTVDGEKIPFPTDESGAPFVELKDDGADHRVELRM